MGNQLYFREPYDPQKEYKTGMGMRFKNGLYGVIVSIERIGPDIKGNIMISGIYRGERP